MNKVVLIGRLTKDPELNFAPGTGNAVANFTMAVDRRFASKDGKREADFIPVVVWGKQGENVANYTSKGKLIGVSGRIQTRSYDAQDGSRRYITEVIADEVQFIEWGGNNSGANQGGFDNNMSGGFNQQPMQSEPSFGDNLTEMDDDEVPF